MFIVTQKPTFTAPVTANIPADNGRVEKVRFSVVFKALEKPEIDSLLARIRTISQATEDITARLTDRDVLNEVLAGFGPDLVEEDRTPMAYTPANVDRLCAIWPLEAAMVKSFFDNYVNAPTKN